MTDDSLLMSLPGAIRRGDSAYFAVGDAPSVVDLLRTRGVAILGFEGLRLAHDGGLVPDLELIADFSAAREPDWSAHVETCARAARQILAEWAADERILVEFVIEAQPQPHHRSQPSRADRGTPIIIDTDIGGDPDDAIALAIGARHLPLALVTTCDELHGQRARFARLLLDLLGADVPVVAGQPLERAGRQFCVAELIPETVPAQPTDLIAAVGEVLRKARGQVRWVGIGPMSNLATVLDAHPSWASRLRVTQMGGALRYRDPSRGTRNIRRDVPAAQTALAVAHRPVLVTSDVTYTAELEITTASVTYQRLAAAGMPSWAQLLHAHLDRWMRDTGHRGSMMHDPLTLAVAAGVPLAETTQGRVVFDERGRMRLDPQGTDALYTQSGDYPRIRSWLDTHLLDRPEQLPGTQPGRKCSG